MNKLLKWLDKNGFDYKIVKYGSDYFYNTSVSFDAVMVVFDREKYGSCIKASEKVEKYAARYGYKIITDGYNISGAWLSIGTSENVLSLHNYWNYQEKAIKECEVIMHNYHLNGIYNSHHAQLESELKSIMSKYESEYIKNSFHVVRAA